MCEVGPRPAPLQTPKKETQGETVGCKYKPLPLQGSVLLEIVTAEKMAELRRGEAGGEEESQLSRSKFKDHIERSNRAADSLTECLGFFHTVEHATNQCV